jgi:oligopeptide transport system substrate-binding protein
MKRRTTLLASAATLLVLTGGVAFAESHTTHPVTGEALAPEQVFTYQDIDESPSIDPGMVEDVAGNDIVRDLWEGLMNQDAAGNLVPGVATGFTKSDDGLTYTFTLRDNAKWSNGDPVTAGDFVYAWRRAASPALASPYAWYMELMSIANVAEVIAGDKPIEELGVSAPDDLTFVVTLSQPLPYFPQMVTTGTTFPVPQKVVEEFGADWTKPEHIVSNGAYVLTEWVPQERMVRERNVNYWNNDATIIDKVVRLVINDDAQALTRFQAGELDKSNIPSGQYPRLKEEFPTIATSVPSLCSYYYFFNLRDDAPEWEKDVRVREALSLAVDRDVIVNNVTAAGQIPAYTFTPGATAGFVVPVVPAAAMTQEERNAKAVELLTAAGYGPDKPLSVEILYNTSEGHKSIALAISQMWKQTLGVEATLRNEEWQTFLDSRTNGTFDVARAGWCGDYNEASTFLDLLTSGSGANDGKYVNAEIDQLMAAAKTMDDPQPNYTRVEEIAAAEVPILPIYHYASVFMLNDHVKGWPLDNVQQTWYSRELYKLAE